MRNRIEDGGLYKWKTQYVQSPRILIDNVAINKPTHQENPAVIYDDRFASSNAVDGLKANHTYNEGQCVLSAYGKHTATWWVNLTSIHSIHHITIFFRTGNEKSGI